MILERQGTRLIVRREASDPKYYRESLFMYHLKVCINRRFGFRCIKKLAWKDGHLVDNWLYYIRPPDHSFYVWYGYSNINTAVSQFNNHGEVSLCWQDNSEVA
jgi:hypothetical protein